MFVVRKRYRIETNAAPDTRWLHGPAAVLTLSLGSDDHFSERPKRALATGHRLILTLHLADAADEPVEKERKNEDCRKRLVPNRQCDPEADGEHDNQEGLLKMAHRFVRQHLSHSGFVELMGLPLQQRGDLFLGSHCLDGLDPVQDICKLPDQRLD